MLKLPTNHLLVRTHHPFQCHRQRGGKGGPDPRQHPFSVEEQEASHAPASPRYSGPATASASFIRSARATFPTTKTMWRDVRKDTTDISSTRPTEVTCGSTSAGRASWALPSPAVTS